MPYFITKDGEPVQFESRRDPIEPTSAKIGAWLAAKWLPIFIGVGNLILICSSRWGFAITSIALYVIGRLGYRGARTAVAEAADWSTHLGRIDKYRAQGARYQRPVVDYHARTELER